MHNIYHWHMDAAGLHTIGEHIRRRQAAIAEKVICPPVHEICDEAEWMPGMIPMVRWWDQDMVNEPED